MFELRYAPSVRGNQFNTSYPARIAVDSAEAFRKAAEYDYVAAEYADGRRKIENFVSSDIYAFDVDNTHSDDPSEWITPEAVRSRFPECEMLVHYSRHNMTEKDGCAPRPRFHFAFRGPRCTDAGEYARRKRALYESVFPFADPQALDAGRFFFGTEVPQVEYYPGEKTLADHLPPEFWAAPAPAAALKPHRRLGSEIPEGERNATLHQFAVRVLKRCGCGEPAETLFSQEAACCNPPLSQPELASIWKSALKFYTEKIASSPDYVPPESYNDPFSEGASLAPENFTDLGEAKVFVQECRDVLAYTENTDLLWYNGTLWKSGNYYAVRVLAEFLRLQQKNAKEQAAAARARLEEYGLLKKGEAFHLKTVLQCIDDLSPADARSWAYRMADAVSYEKFAVERENMRNVLHTLDASRAGLLCDISDFDADPYLLNTPSYTYDLRLGPGAPREHSPEDRLTCVTAVDPGDRGAEIWQKALELFFCGDEALIRYVQQIAGLAAIGSVNLEAAIIAYGDGSNGKSTFWNTIFRILGSYGGKLSADALTAGCKRNVMPELAELKGKRLVIASELEDGQRLNSSVVKHLSSTDEIFAEKKYLKPFYFRPSHTLVLYTNYLPRVGALDDGTWRRLIVIPFQAKITGQSDIKNYSEYLEQEAGPAILKWVMEGAQAVIRMNFKPEMPHAVQKAIADYREANDWLSAFLEEECELSPEYRQKSGELYTSYRAYCERFGEFPRKPGDFYTALENRGYGRKKTSAGRFLLGLRLKQEIFSP